MKKLLLTMALCAITAVMQAVPARRNVHTVAQSDGSTLKIRLRGDESFHYLETADGHPIVNTSNGYMYGKVENGRLMSSGILAHDAAMRGVSEQSHLRFSGSLTRSGVSRLWNIRKESRNQHRMARHNKFRAMQESEAVKSRVGATSTTTKKGLVILVNFANKTMKSSTANADFDEMFNKVGYNKNRHIGSVRDYFTDQSHGQLTIDFDIVGPYNLSNDMSYYGKNNSDDDDLRPGEMIAEACRLANGDVNFKDYDWDGDGEVDQVYVVYAGYGESSGAPSSTIWPHEWELTSSDYGKSLRLDNVTINTYACSNELAGTSGSRMDGIGTACPEFSHCLGLPDLYDTDEEDGMNFGMDSWSLMDYGCYNGPNGYNGNVPCAYTAYEKFYCGWIEPTVLDEGCNVDGMKAITDSDDSYIIYNDGNKNEYYVLFNIQQKSWNQYAEGHGMLVIHVDYNESVWESNGVNAKEGHPRCTIIPADDEFTTEVEYDGEIYDIPDLTGDPYPGSKTNTSLTDTSTPAATLYSNNSNGKKLLSRPIEDIVEKDGLISFKFNGGKLLDTPVANEAQSIGADSFIASWNAVEGAESYTLELQETYEAEVSILLDENFVNDFKSNSVNNSTDIASTLNDYLTTKGCEGSKLFSGGSYGLKFGSSKATGSLTTPALSNVSADKLTIYLEATPYGTSDTPTFKVSCGNASETVKVQGKYAVVTLAVNSTSPKVRIETTSPTRAYLGRLVISEGAFDAESILAVVSSGPPARRARAIRSTYFEGIEDTEYTLNQLTGTEYNYRVKAVSKEGASAWSNLIHVTLVADAITGVSADGLSGDAALYTLGGILLQKGASVNEARLPSGVYILKENGKTRKVVVR